MKAQTAREGKPPKRNSLFLRLPSVKNQYSISILKSEWFYRKAAKTFSLSPTIKQWNLNTKVYFNYGTENSYFLSREICINYKKIHINEMKMEMVVFCINKGTAGYQSLLAKLHPPVLC